MYQRSVFVHHFKCEGIEKGDKEDTAENVIALVVDYLRVGRERQGDKSSINVEIRNNVDINE